jgi:ABC-type sugar transport system ATPase subunit
VKGGVRVERLSFRIGDFELKAVSLDVAEGEYFVLTGPNGAGKTVLMRLIAGLETPDSGEVHIAGTDSTDLPPWRRPIGYVPQEMALFPHRNVRRNITFGPEMRLRRLDFLRRGRSARRAAAEEIDRALSQVAHLTGVSHLLERSVEGLSGGEKQKVSLARALILEPAVLLLDEPVSAIDEADRDRLCGELKSIQERTGVTTIHVSHSRREAELVADRTAVMRGGAILPPTTPGKSA